MLQNARAPPKSNASVDEEGRATGFNYYEHVRVRVIKKASARNSHHSWRHAIRWLEDEDTCAISRIACHI